MSCDASSPSEPRDQSASPACRVPEHRLVDAALRSASAPALASSTNAPFRRFRSSHAHDISRMGGPHRALRHQLGLAHPERAASLRWAYTVLVRAREGRGRHPHDVEYAISVVVRVARVAERIAVEVAWLGIRHVGTVVCDVQHGVAVVVGVARIAELCRRRGWLGQRSSRRGSYRWRGATPVTVVVCVARIAHRSRSRRRLGLRFARPGQLSVTSGTPSRSASGDRSPGRVIPPTQPRDRRLIRPIGIHGPDADTPVSVA